MKYIYVFVKKILTFTWQLFAIVLSYIRGMPKGIHTVDLMDFMVVSYNL